MKGRGMKWSKLPLPNIPLTFEKDCRSYGFDFWASSPRIKI